MDRRIIPCLAVVATILASGCAAPKSSLTSSDYQDRVGRVRKVGVVVAEARIMNLQAGGGASLNPAASERCATCAAAAVKQSLEGRGYEAAVIPLDDETRALLAEYLGVRGEFGKLFPSNQGRIEGLSPLPSVPQACARNGVDALVFVGALDHVSTGSRKALLGALAVFGIVGGAGIAYADLSAVDSSGKIIFHDLKSGSNYTLTGEEGVQNMFGELVAGLPLAGGR